VYRYNAKLGKGGREYGCEIANTSTTNDNNNIDNDDYTTMNMNVITKFWQGAPLQCEAGQSRERVQVRKSY